MKEAGRRGSGCFTVVCLTLSPWLGKFACAWLPARTAVAVRPLPLSLSLVLLWFRPPTNAIFQARTQRYDSEARARSHPIPLAQSPSSSHQVRSKSLEPFKANVEGYCV
ncbi:hypothetical protein IE53DRAFT_92059 [Violaceomyces palustris]|uniref:Uncharacterized protein n=1 Tax=Violaceomyces palustris TaxID=1673888 RepID=A0ACD0NXH3_9BASI|nr:hypothetical protein IE53DRAFT_92059 [Violaceomyces palustris]